MQQSRFSLRAGSSQADVKLQRSHKILASAMYFPSIHKLNKQQYIIFIIQREEEGAEFHTHKFGTVRGVKSEADVGNSS